MTGTVDFSTTILKPSLTVSRMFRAAISTYFKSGAFPLPIPPSLVGVFTLTNINWDSKIASDIFVEKNKFFPRYFCTISSKPIT